MKPIPFLFSALLGGAVLSLAARRVVGSLHSPSAGSAFDEMDRYLTAEMKRLNLPGACLAIVEGEQIRHLRGFGRARPGGVAPSPQTPFYIGSTAKSITALAVMQLVEKGQVDLDTPVTRYLPWFRVTQPKRKRQLWGERLAISPTDENGREIAITVRHLLNQASGLPLLPGWVLLSDSDDRPGAAERQLRGLAGLTLNHQPGEAFEYSNLNYNLLGLVVEVASGEAYADYIHRHIFYPLRMDHSHTARSTAQSDGLAAGHQSWFGIPLAAAGLPTPVGSLASGQLISSAEDMGRYLIAHLNGGRYGGVQILSAEGMAELHQPGVETRMLDGGKCWYAMGWYVEEREGVKTLSHSGLTPDFYAFMALLPEQQKGLVLLVNADHFTMQMSMYDVCAGLVSHLSGAQQSPRQYAVLPWVQRGLLLIPLLQIVDAIHTLELLRRWRKDPSACPGRREVWKQHILPSLLLNLPAMLTMLPLTTRLRGFLRLFAPDLSLIPRVCGGFAGVWIVLRSWLILRVSKAGRLIRNKPTW